MEKEGEKEERPLKLEPWRRKFASYRHRKVKRKMKTQEEGDKEERLLKLEQSQPSEDCVSRLFEDQRFRLHNSNPTFQGISQESGQEPPRFLRKEALAYANGSPPRGSSNTDARIKPDFSTRLLKILRGTKKEGELNDVKTMVKELEFVGANFGEIMQGPPQSEVFKEVAPNMNELNSYAHLDLSSSNISDRPQIREDIAKFDRLYLEETDFSSESSDEDERSEVENRQEIHAPGYASSDCSNKLFQAQKAAQLESFSPPHSKGPSFISPRHLSRSSGSRSSPSRSSIPGLRSKYSKPDPQAKQLAKHARPLCLLPKFEVRTEGSNKLSLKGDDIASNAFSDVHEKELDKSINFDWWESDEDDNVINDSSADVKAFNRHELGEPLKLQLGSDVETNSCNQSPSNDRNSGISKRVDISNKQKGKKLEDWCDFEWSDSDEEGDTRAEDNQLSEWSVSDADSGLSEGRQSDSHASDRNGKESGLVCPTAEHPTSPQRKRTTKEYGTTSTSIRPLFWYNREECEKLAFISYVDCKPLNQLPSSVKFVEVPPWRSQRIPHLPFEFQFSYSEIPKSPILGFRDHYSPFAPTTMGRPWTGRHLVKPRSLEARQTYDPMLVKAKLFEFSFNRKGEPPKRVKSREELLGEPLTDDEVMRLVRDCHVEKRQVNLGRDGLTHNMLDLIHTHWKSRPVCRIKCRGAPTLDMDNVCFHVEDKTGGQIIYRAGCVLYVFRGRYYSYKHRPVLPLMLYRPSSPVYPKLVPQAPAGLTLEEASQLRILGQKVRPLIKLQKNGAFPDLVKLVRDAFMVDNLVSLDYGDLKAADYRQIGAKLRELVPCVLLSFRNRRIVLWRGKDSNPSSPHSSQVHGECSAEVIDVEGSVVSAAEFKSMDISNEEPLIGKAPKAGIEKVEDTSVISAEKSEENVELQHRFEYVLNGSSGSEQHIQERDEPQSAARDMVEASSTSGELNGIWDMALKDGVAVKLEGDHLEADFILQIASVLSEVAPLGPDYTVSLINRLRLQGVYEKSPRQFVVPFRVKREMLPRWKRLRKQSSHVKRHPDTGYAVEALARILHQN